MCNKTKTLFSFKLWNNPFEKKLVEIQGQMKKYLLNNVSVLEKYTFSILQKLQVKSHKQIMRKQAFHIKKLILGSKWSSGSPGYFGYMYSGTQSQTPQVPNEEGLAISNKAVSVCPHTNGGELAGLGQTCFLKISVPSFFMAHPRILYLMLSYTESLPAFLTFL